MNKKNIQRTLEAAIAHQRAGEFEAAEQLYAQVRSAFPKLFDGWYLSGTLAYYRGGQVPQAIDFLTRALRLDPRSSQCKLFLGMALADAGRHAEAEKPLRAGLEKHPNYADAWENLATVLFETGRATEAEECLRTVLRLQPNRTDIQERLSGTASAT